MWESVRAVIMKLRQALSYAPAAGWAFVDESPWPTGQTIAMFETKDSGYGLLLSQSLAGTIEAYFGLLRQSFATMEGTDKAPRSRSLSSSSGSVDALRRNFVTKTSSRLKLQYRLLTWKVRNRFFRLSCSFRG